MFAVILFVFCCLFILHSLFVCHCCCCCYFFIIAVVQARDFVVEMNLNEMNDIFWSILHGIVIMDHIHFAYRITCKHLTIHIFDQSAINLMTESFFRKRQQLQSFSTICLMSARNKTKLHATQALTTVTVLIAFSEWRPTENQRTFSYFIIVYSIFFLFGVSKYAN